MKGTRTVIDQVASGIVQVMAGAAAIIILVLDKGMGELEEPLSWHFYAIMVFIALGARLKDINSLLLRILSKNIK